MSAAKLTVAAFSVHVQRHSAAGTAVCRLVYNITCSIRCLLILANVLVQYCAMLGMLIMPYDGLMLAAVNDSTLQSLSTQE